VIAKAEEVSESAQKYGISLCFGSRMVREIEKVMVRES
jgi:hypothetical protein